MFSSGEWKRKPKFLCNICVYLFIYAILFFHRFHQVDSDCLTMAVNFWWRSEVMLRMSEHMDGYYMRRIVKRCLFTSPYFIFKNVSQYNKLMYFLFFTCIICCLLDLYQRLTDKEMVSYRCISFI